MNPLFHETQSRHEYGIYMIHLNQIICNKKNLVMFRENDTD